MGSNPIPRINYPTLVRHLTRIHIYYYHLLTMRQGAPVKTTATNPTAPYRSTNSVKNVTKSLHVSPVGEPLTELLEVLKHA